MTILDVKDLTKIYRDKPAVDAISFSVDSGICFGLLGPNGAGKTTTIEMIEGISEITSGEIFYQGKPIGDTFKQEAGIQFQQTALMDYLTVQETLELFASFYDKTLPLADLIHQCNLQDFIHQRSTQLSGGQRQRLLLAIALVNDPQILFLDEPTTGLDPQARRNFWDLINNIKAQGKTVFLTTHYMDEAEILCDQLVIMDKGKIIDQGSPTELLGKHFPLQRVSISKAAITQFNNLTEEVISDDSHHHILTASAENIIKQLLDDGVDISSLSVSKPNLEDLFLKLTGHQLRQ